MSESLEELAKETAEKYIVSQMPSPAIVPPGREAKVARWAEQSRDALAPYILSALRKAVEEEREATAQLAELWWPGGEVLDRFRLQPNKEPWIPPDTEYGIDLATDGIAAAIRSRSKESTNAET